MIKKDAWIAIGLELFFGLQSELLNWSWQSSGKPPMDPFFAWALLLSFFAMLAAMFYAVNRLAHSYGKIWVESLRRIYDRLA